MARAQTTLDFLVGTSVFLLTVAAVFTTVPGLMDPFVSGSEANTIVADRTVESLATDVLAASPSTPFVFVEEDVDAFFSLAPSAAKDRLGVSSSVSLNVTLRNATQTLRSVGPPVTDPADVTAAWRSARYRDEHVELVVRVW